MPEQDAATIIILTATQARAKVASSPDSRVSIFPIRSLSFEQGHCGCPKPENAIRFLSHTVVVPNSLKMSGSDNLTVSFGVLEDQESLRLLELPPALLASITSANPPRYLFHQSYDIRTLLTWK